MAYFPMFIQLEDRPCLIIGGGAVALRKVRVLRDFGARVLVVADEILSEIKNMDGVDWQERGFLAEDLEGHTLVVAATDDKEENHRISCLCREKQIAVNAVDQIEDCSFIFPAYLKEGEVVAAFSSGGQSPVVTQYLKEKMRPEMTGLLGNLAAWLGEVRKMVKRTGTASGRKAVYEELLRRGLEAGAPLSREEIQKVVEERRL